MKNITKIIVLTLSGILIFLCFLSPVWYRILVEEVSYPAGVGTYAIVFVFTFGILTLVCIVNGKFWLSIFFAFLTLVAVIGADESSLLGYVLVGILSLFLLSFFWRVFRRMLNDSVQPKMRVGGKPEFYAWAEEDKVVFETNEPRSYAFNEITACLRRPVYFEGINSENGLARYSFQSNNPDRAVLAITRYARSALKIGEATQRIYRDGRVIDIPIHTVEDFMGEVDGRRLDE